MIKIELNDLPIYVNGNLLGVGGNLICQYLSKRLESNTVVGDDYFIIIRVMDTGEAFTECNDIHNHW